VVRAIVVTAIVPPPCNGRVSGRSRRRRWLHRRTCRPLGFYGGTSLPDTFGLGRKLTLRRVRSIAAHTLSTAAPLLVAWPDLIVSGLPNDTAHCQSPRSSRTTVYSMPRYSIDRPICKANLPSRTPPQWSILLALRKLNGQRPTTRELPSAICCRVPALRRAPTTIYQRPPCDHIPQAGRSVACFESASGPKETAPAQGAVLGLLGAYCAERNMHNALG
jgi:hypothetical protein